MGQWIDQLACALASGVSRREVLRWLGGGAAAAAVGSQLAGEAQAARCPGGKAQLKCRAGNAKICLDRDNSNCKRCGDVCTSGSCCPTGDTNGVQKSAVCCTADFPLCCPLAAGGGCCPSNFPQCCADGQICCPATYICVPRKGCRPPSQGGAADADDTRIIAGHRRRA